MRKRGAGARAEVQACLSHNESSRGAGKTSTGSCDSNKNSGEGGTGVVHRLADSVVSELSMKVCLHFKE